MNKVLLIMGLALIIVGVAFLAFSLNVETVVKEEIEPPHMGIPETPTFTRITSTNILLAASGCVLFGIGVLLVIGSTKTD